MGLQEGFENIRRERLDRLYAAFDAAMRWELYRTSLLLGEKIRGMGVWMDVEGNWREDTRPIRPIAPALPADGNES